VITVIDYGVGNLRSVAKALEAAGGRVCVSGDAADLRRAERLVLPGVGAFAAGMANLVETGLVDALTQEVRQEGKPLLAICLGMQLLTRESEEDGWHAGLGWLPARVVEFDTTASGLKVPHMGWNEIVPRGEAPFFAGLGSKPIFYFVHSYHLACDDVAMIAATCDYGGLFPAVVRHANILATQFHPEKSQDDGLRLLRNFLAWSPAAC
jgi:glutamine amidotransferase